MDTISSAVVRDVSDLAELSIDDVWSWLDDDERLEACTVFWNCDDDSLARERLLVRSSLSKRLHFRSKTMEKLPPEALGRHLAKGAASFRKHRDSFIRAWLLSKHRDLICVFLDGAGLEHAQGLIESEVAEPTGDQLTAGIRTVADGRSRGLRIYLGFVIATGGNYWAALPEAIGRSGFPMQDGLGTREEAEEERNGDAVVEQSDAFNTLDNTLIRLSVASAFGEEGALDHEQLADLIDEVVELNSQRHHSLFHRGYLHALLDQPFEFRFPGENEARRLWYCCGVLFGLLRRDAKEECVELLRTQADLAQGLAENRAVRCGVMLLPHLMTILLDGGEHDLLGKWIGRQLERATVGVQIQVLTNFYYRASAQLRRGNAAEAGLLLAWVMEGMENFDAMPKDERPHGFVETFSPQVVRKVAQVDQLQGSFERATALLESVSRSENLDEERAANALCDLGLIEGGFRSLAGCLPATSGKGVEAIREALLKGVPMFERAVKEHAAAATNAHFVLGLFLTLDPASDMPDLAQRRADHFRQAMSGMMRNRSKYDEVDLLDWARFGLALALLETLNRSELMHAVDDLRHVVTSKVFFPMTLWRRVLTALATFESDEIAIGVAQELLEERGSEALPALEESGLAVADAGIRDACFKWLDTCTLAPSQLWGRFEGLLPGALRDGDVEQAGEILDRLEALAMTHETLRAGFVRLLDDPDRWSPAWEQEDVDYVRVRLLELDGDFLPAFQILRGHFLKIRDDGRSHRIEEAREVVGRIERYRLDGDPAEELRALLIDEESDDHCKTVRDRLLGGEKVRVLYVGGNETQEAYENSIRERLAKDYPGLSVDYEFPGWSSNWNKPLARIVDRLHLYRCVVIHRYVRTMFGRKLRAACSGDCPWLPCTGSGRDSLERAIVGAACFVLRKGGD